MAFDADQHHANVCPPWSFTRDGRTFVAQYVSAPMVERYILAHNAAKSLAAQERALMPLLRAAFPMRWSYRWRPTEDPVHQLLTLDVPTRNAALDSFCQALGIRNQTPQGAPAPGSSAAGSAGDGSVPSAT